MIKFMFTSLISVMLLSSSVHPQPALQQPERPRGQIPDLGRQTEKLDEVPTFNYNQYFPGTWQFEWRVPDSPLGLGGTLRGTEIFTVQDGNFSTSHTEAEGPTGTFTIDSVISYQAKQRTFARLDRDSRGFELFHAGPIGGDLGGFYTIHYETGPLIHAGQKVRLRYRTRLVSPLNYKVEARISIDDGPFLNFGSAWFQKEMTADSKP